MARCSRDSTLLTAELPQVLTREPCGGKRGNNGSPFDTKVVITFRITFPFRFINLSRTQQLHQPQLSVPLSPHKVGSNIELGTNSLGSTPHFLHLSSLLSFSSLCQSEVALASWSAGANCKNQEDGKWGSQMAMDNWKETCFPCCHPDFHRAVFDNSLCSSVNVLCFRT